MGGNYTSTFGVIGGVILGVYVTKLIELTADPLAATFAIFSLTASIAVVRAAILRDVGVYGKIFFAAGAACGISSSIFFAYRLGDQIGFSSSVLYVSLGLAFFALEDILNWSLRPKG